MTEDELMKKIKVYCVEAVDGLVACEECGRQLVAENKWLAQVFGDPNGTAWEISVVRENNKHGRKSWGWFDSEKLLVSHNGGPCKWPLATGLGDKMIKLAQELANQLNEGENDG